MKLPRLKPDSVFAVLTQDEIEAAWKFTDAEDFGETHGISERMLKRLVELKLIKEDETNRGLYWPTDRLEELTDDIVAAETQHDGENTAVSQSATSADPLKSSRQSGG